MTIASTILSIALIVFFGMFGGAKILLVPAMVQRVAQAGLSIKACRNIGWLEVGACFGLLIGLFWAPLSIVAAFGLFVLMVGAVWSQLRAGDNLKATLPIVWLGLAALAASVVTFLDLIL